MNFNIVVGCGFSGAVIANLIADKLNQKVIIIDKKNHIAGNSYDYRDKNNIMIHKYGSHIFHTNNEKVWSFLKRFSDFNNYIHKVDVVIDGKKVQIPFNFNTLYQLFSETTAKKIKEKLLEKYNYGAKIPILEFQKQNDEDLKFLAKYVYEKIFLNYTIKQWELKPNEIDKTITSRVPLCLDNDNRYFQDKYQGIPINGYTNLIEKIINHPNIKVVLNSDYKNFKKQNSELIKNSRIFYTGSIDEFFDYEYGMLPYRSLKFEFEEHNKEFYQSCACINYPNDFSFTRIHEFKYYLGDKSNKTIIAKEYPQKFKFEENERYYPIINEENIKLYNKYLKKAENFKNIYFLGRLGDYKYYNMDLAVLRAIELFEAIKFNVI